jgi:hypothetical protein
MKLALLYKLNFTKVSVNLEKNVIHELNLRHICSLGFIRVAEGRQVPELCLRGGRGASCKSLGTSGLHCATYQKTACSYSSL